MADGLYELTEDVSASPLYSKDLAPTKLAERTWNTWHLASLWIGMAVCIPTYMLASGLLAQGMTWLEAVGTIFLANFIVLIPMVLNGHAGTKYGIPLPVFLRASFGSAGAHVPSILRGLVACGWFGIQTWIGGACIYELLAVLYPAFKTWPMLGDFLGINAAQLLCFAIFWVMNLYFVIKGTESIKWLEVLSAPVLILIGVALVAWGVSAGGGFIRVLNNSTNFSRMSTDGPIVRIDGQLRAKEMRVAPTVEGLKTAEWMPVTTSSPAKGGWTMYPPAGAKLFVQYRTTNCKESPPLEFGGGGSTQTGPQWLLYLTALTAMVGFWATLSLNIPDFTRYAKSQKDQLLGQAYGLPTTMTFYSFVGVFVTCASLLAFDDIVLVQQAPWDPVALMSRFHNPIVVIVSMIMLLVATLTTNIAANVVAPANGFANLFPKHISFKMGGIITAVIGILIMPWKLTNNPKVYIYDWLIGYSALLGPIAGIMIADYFVVRRTKLDVAALFRPSGVNWGTIAILAIAVAPNVPGFLANGHFIGSVPEIWSNLFKFAWFVGFGIAFVLYSIYGKLTWKPTATT